MSEIKPVPTKVPDGKSRFVTTRQKEPNEKGFIGFETVWEPFQKEAEYKSRNGLKGCTVGYVSPGSIQAAINNCFGHCTVTYAAIAKLRRKGRHQPVPRGSALARLLPERLSDPGRQGLALLHPLPI